MTRAAHWIKGNAQVRIPKRWVAFDTEARTEKGNDEDIQSWASGAAVSWRRDLSTGIHRRSMTFDDPTQLWSWITKFCSPGVRTVVVAHNLGYDIRISRVLDVLPDLGWSLDWCNLDRNVSSMTWRSDRGTLIFSDLFTWIPKPLFEIGNMLDLPKLKMPSDDAPRDKWDEYCLRDAEIVHRAVTELVDYAEEHELGNWQPTGAGMAYSVWRHKFMTHKVLVHDEKEVLEVEREAMHTGRAEAWRHGALTGDTWHEVDLRSAYTRIAAECELPVKLKFSTGPITLAQYENLSGIYRVLCRVRVCTTDPIAPVYTGVRTIWPVGTFQTCLWDVEVNELLSHGQSVTILSAHCYTKGKLLGDWATWALSVAGDDSGATPRVVRAWAKHAGRALIGRLSLRVPSWELFGANPDGLPGLSYTTDYGSTDVQRFMHIGDKTFVETARRESDDSVPQITGWIMAECRVRLYWAMCAAGFDNIAHVDTDCVIVNAEGLRNLRRAYSTAFHTLWQIKATWTSLMVYGPRNLRAGRDRKVAGVPKAAKEVSPNVFTGEKWRGLAADMTAGRSGSVTIEPGRWELKTEDPRRLSAAGTGGRTVPIVVDLNGYVRV